MPSGQGSCQEIACEMKAAEKAHARPGGGEMGLDELRINPKPKLAASSLSSFWDF
jgi:hypothetical protein